MLYNHKLGCISASNIIILTGVFLLIWAFGSYLVYVLTIQNPDLCFPPLSGCTSISHAGNYPFSGFFYRLLVLPLAPLLGKYMYFIIQFLENIIPDVRPNIKRILFIFGCIILPISLIVTETFKDGHRFHPSYVSDLHVLFAGIAFLMLIIFQIITSFQLLRAKSIFYKFMFFLSLFPIFMIIFQYSTHIEGINDIVEWNVFVALMIWNILIGVRIKKA
jgi:hypothetical protein